MRAMVMVCVPQGGVSASGGIDRGGGVGRRRYWGRAHRPN